ncbi:MAG: radical SAM family heme chaperone HemW [Clostridia bacterium]|nr:radical SAM family heme chaperone HemW [Clostridia bacterium]
MDSKLIIKVIEKIKEVFIVSEQAEITIEINPGTITKEKLLDYKSCNVNRISIGCQAIQNELLVMLGRIHNYEEFLTSYKLVKEVGFENVNVDLMLGLPNQKIKDIENSVTEILKLNPKHISVYSLILEEGTVLEKKIALGELALPSEKEERLMYKRIKKMLEKNNYKHYEISNFAKEDFESKHNIACWNQEEYIGFGLASHSYLDGKRFSNIENLENYIRNIENNELEKNIIIHEIQSEEEKKKEYMLLGLRKIDGVSISKFEQKFRINPLFYFRFEISKLEENGLLEVDLDNIKLTKKGLDFANLVWEEFV